MKSWGRRLTPPYDGWSQSSRRRHCRRSKANSVFLDGLGPRTNARAKLWFRVQLALATAAGVAVYVAVARQPELFGGRQIVHESVQLIKTTREPAPAPIPKPQSPIPGVPLPTNYGVFTVADGKLMQLELLPIRVPDPVSISAVISTPSPTAVPDGRLQFLVFRRDLTNSAPESAVVRVVAQVKRALTFTDGKAMIQNVENAWAVRGDATR